MGILYYDVELEAGGIWTSDKAWIKACHAQLGPTGRLNKYRKDRHLWIRSNLEQRDKQRELCHKFRM